MLAGVTFSESPRTGLSTRESKIKFFSLSVQLITTNQRIFLKEIIA
jgi:hypothetical protein